MRKVLYSVMSLAAAAAFAAPAMAQPPGYRAYDYAPAHHSRAATDFTAGAVGGTVAGLGVSEGWWGATATAALPATAAGAAAVGGVAGIGAVAALDSVTEPCRGFAAMFDASHGECMNGHYVGSGAERPMARRPYR